MRRELPLTVMLLATWLALGCGAPVINSDAGEVPVSAPLDAGTDAGVDDGGTADVDAGPADAGTSHRATSIDAVLNLGTGKLFFFKGAEYLRYDLATDMADPGYPRPIVPFWPGLWDAGVDSATEIGTGKLWFFRGADWAQYDIARDAVDPGFPQPIAIRWPALGDGGVNAALRITHNDGGSELQLFQGRQVLTADGLRLASDVWPGLGLEPVDAVVETGARAYFFQGDTYRRFDTATHAAAAGYPLERKWYWPGLWDPQDGTGHPGERLPAELALRLFENPTAAELTARRQRVSASATIDWVEISAQYPRFLASVEARLSACGCGLFKSTTVPPDYRFRCATNTSGAERLDVAPITIPFIDWRAGAYHVDQVSQGDFMADVGTPLSIFATDDGTFFVAAITPNAATGSISAGLNVRVHFRSGGVLHVIGFSHLNTRVPGYVLDAARDGTPLATGTVFGFIGYTGNLWIGAPPATDAPYQGAGADLPTAHSHLWFKDSLDDHLKLSVPARKALDFTRSYPYGGG